MPATQRSRNRVDVLPQAISEHSAGACMGPQWSKGKLPTGQEKCIRGAGGAGISANRGSGYGSAG
jgi:hypothetical protein